MWMGSMADLPARAAGERAARPEPATSPAPGATRQTSSLKRGLAVLELVAQAGKDGIGVTEVAARVGLDKSSASRILATLGELGYVRQDINRRYFTTPRLGKLAHRRPGVQDLAALARERLEELHATHDEAVHLAVVNGGEMLFLDYLQTTKAVRTEIPMVPRPIHEVAVGIAVLAAVGHAERTQLMRESMAAAGQHPGGGGPRRHLGSAGRCHLDVRAQLSDRSRRRGDRRRHHRRRRRHQRRTSRLTLADPLRTPYSEPTPNAPSRTSNFDPLARIRADSEPHGQRLILRGHRNARTSTFDPLARKPANPEPHGQRLILRGHRG
jgi:DNA-binding transcriptional ArsR family regulator